MEDTRLQLISSLPADVERLVKLVRDLGGRAFLVGGCVRDALMGTVPKDWDVEVFGIEADRLRELVESFDRVSSVGESFRVYKIGDHLDVSIPRRERKSGRGHRAFEIEGDPHLPVADAARRRDFTVNAILWDPLTEELIDPFDGRGDLKRKVLRAVDAGTFPEDSLRVLRAAQFAARFEFDLDPATIELCRGMDLTDLPAERIWGELEKLLLLAAKPSVGLHWLYELRVAEKLFPELAALCEVPQDPEWHPEGDVKVHTQLVVDRARERIADLPYGKKITVMLGALCHDLGKPATTEFLDGHWRSRGHEEAGVAPTRSLLDRLNIHKLDGYDVRAQVVSLVRDHLKPGELFKQREVIGPGAIRRLARRVEPDLLYRVASADSLGRNAEWVPREKWYGAEAQEWFIEQVRELQVEVRAPKPILMGRHLLELGMTASPAMGEITKAVYEMQLDGRVTNLDEALAAGQALLAQQPENKIESLEAE